LKNQLGVALVALPLSAAEKLVNDEIKVGDQVAQFAHPVEALIGGAFGFGGVEEGGLLGPQLLLVGHRAGDFVERIGGLAFVDQLLDLLGGDHDLKSGGGILPPYFYYIIHFQFVSSISVYIIKMAGFLNRLIAQFFNAAHTSLKSAHILLINLLPANLFINLGLLGPVGKGHGQVGVLADDLCFFETGHNQEIKGLY